MLKISENYSQHPMTYEEAVMYCFIHEEDGLSGWRLPTRKEFYAHMVNSGEEDLGCFVWLSADNVEGVTKLWAVPVKDVND